MSLIDMGKSGKTRCGSIWPLSEVETLALRVYLDGVDIMSKSKYRSRSDVGNIV